MTADNELLRDCIVQLLSLARVPGLRVARGSLSAVRSLLVAVEIPENTLTPHDDPITVALVDYVCTGNFASLAVVLDEEASRIDAELNRPITEADMDAALRRLPDNRWDKEDRDGRREYLTKAWRTPSDSSVTITKSGTGYQWMDFDGEEMPFEVKTVRDLRDFIRIFG